MVAENLLVPAAGSVVGESATGDPAGVDVAIGEKGPAAEDPKARSPADAGEREWWVLAGAGDSVSPGVTVGETGDGAEDPGDA
jgi:hypothetical protein